MEWENRERKRSELPDELCGLLGSLFFTGQPVVDYVSAKSSDTVAFAEYFKKMLNMGIHMAPSQFEAMFCQLIQMKLLWKLWMQ